MEEGEQAEFFGKLPYAQRRKFEQTAAGILNDEWNTIGKDLGVDLLGSVDVVRGWWMGDFNPGLQVFIDKADEKQTDAAAATLAYVLDQHGVGVVESIKVVDEGQAPNGIVVKGPASKRDFDRITKVMQDVFTEAGYAEMTSFSFPFDVARKQIGLAYHGSTESITEENLNEIERRLGENMKLSGQTSPTDSSANRSMRPGQSLLPEGTQILYAEGYAKREMNSLRSAATKENSTSPAPKSKSEESGSPALISTPKKENSGPSDLNPTDQSPETPSERKPSPSNE